MNHALQNLIKFLAQTAVEQYLNELRAEQLLPYNEQNQAAFKCDSLHEANTQKEPKDEKTE